jgi:hypothetical protein
MYVISRWYFLLPLVRVCDTEAGQMTHRILSTASMRDARVATSARSGQDSAAESQPASKTEGRHLPPEASLVKVRRSPLQEQRQQHAQQQVHDGVAGRDLFATNRR